MLKFQYNDDPAEAIHLVMSQSLALFVALYVIWYVRNYARDSTQFYQTTPHVPHFQNWHSLTGVQGSLLPHALIFENIGHKNFLGA